MIEINGHQYNATCAYPDKKIIATVIEPNFSVLAADAVEATLIKVVNDGVMTGEYACAFLSLDKQGDNAIVKFSLGAFTLVDGEEIKADVAQSKSDIQNHSETLADNAVELSDILDAITELGNLVAELVNGGNE